MSICIGHEDSVRDAALSGDGKRIVTASSDGTARVWDATSGGQLAICGEISGFAVRRAFFNPEGSRIVTASDDHTARIWDAATGAPVATLEGHNGPVLSAAFSLDGAYIATASEDGTARVWDAVAGGCLARIDAGTDDASRPIQSD